MATAGNTYLAGCTDAQYTDGSCPWKSDDFDEQEWVGLVRCDAVNKTANEWAWAGCSVPADAYTSLRRMGTCDCTSKATLFVGEQALLRHASLPSSVGGTISWEDGYAVTAAAETTSSSSSSSPAATAGSAATGSSASATTTTTSAAATAATGTQAASSSSGDGGADSSPSLSTGAKAGIAVGAIGAVLSVLAIAVMVFLHRRRRRGDPKGEYSEAPPPPHDKVPGTPTVMMTDGNDGMAPPAYPAYSGHKAELPGSSLSVVTTTQQALSPGLRSTPSTVSRAQSEFGERRMSLVSELSNNDDGPRVLYQAMPTQAGMAPISELQG